MFINGSKKLCLMSLACLLMNANSLFNSKWQKSKEEEEEERSMSVSECNPSISDRVVDSAYVEGLCGKTFYPESKLTFGQPRGMFVIEDNDEEEDGYVVLGIERNLQIDYGNVVWYKDSNHDGVAEEGIVLASAPKLNHGIVVFDGYIYASSDTTVYKWPYLKNSNGELMKVGNNRTTVISNMNADGQYSGAPGSHKTRSLVFDDKGRLYVSIGSANNVDDTSYRARIRRFDLYDDNMKAIDIPLDGIDFQGGYVFADGLRNDVGLAFDKDGVLWGVDLSADDLYRADLGGDINDENPGEELNRFSSDDEGKHWGYPWCWSEYYLPPSVGGGKGTVWAWPMDNMEEGFITTFDDWCRANTMPSIVTIQAHSAPLGITFYKYNSNIPSYCEFNNGEYPFPSKYDGDAFIAYHGSFNREIPTGYKVVRVPMGDDGYPINASDDPIDIFYSSSSTAQWPSGLRPVDVKFDACGRLIVSSDGTRNPDDSYYGQTIVTLYSTEQG